MFKNSPYDWIFLLIYLQQLIYLSRSWLLEISILPSFLSQPVGNGNFPTRVEYYPKCPCFSYSSTFPFPRKGITEVIKVETSDALKIK